MITVAVLVDVVAVGLRFTTLTATAGMMRLGIWQFIAAGTTSRYTGNG